MSICQATRRRLNFVCSAKGGRGEEALLPSEAESACIQASCKWGSSNLQATNVALSRLSRPWSDQSLDSSAVSLPWLAMAMQ